MSTPVKTRDDISIKTMLEEYATFVETCGVRYYFLPFWFKVEYGIDEFEMLHLDHLPEELKKAIAELRDHPENFLTAKR